MPGHTEEKNYTQKKDETHGRKNTVQQPANDWPSFSSKTDFWAWMKTLLQTFGKSQLFGFLQIFQTSNLMLLDGDTFSDTPLYTTHTLHCITRMCTHTLEPNCVVRALLGPWPSDSYTPVHACYTTSYMGCVYVPITKSSNRIYSVFGQLHTHNKGLHGLGKSLSYFQGMPKM